MPVKLLEHDLSILDWRAASGKLSAVIAASIPACTQLDILVGYFYFNGFDGLYEALRSNPGLKMRILVGMSAGTDKNTREVVEMTQRYEHDNPETIREAYARRLSEVINALAPKTDNRQGKNLADHYLKMIKEGRLLIRQAREENHAKLYLFKPTAPAPGFYVVGSSNFSKPGLEQRHELSVQVAHAGMNDMRELFNEAWEAAVPVTRFKDFSPDQPGAASPTTGPADRDPVENSLAKTHFAEISPYDAYLFVMQRYLQMTDPGEPDQRIRLLIERAKFSYLDYQGDAVAMALPIIERFGGVLLGDVTGLGKSVMAAALAACLRKPGLVLCPPHMIKDWQDYLGFFELDALGWQAHSMYQIEKLVGAPAMKNAKVLIVDEVHRFRNPETDGYAGLHNVCKSRQVILLTATPFSNRPRDVLALLALFRVAPVPGGSKALMDVLSEHDKEFIAAIQEIKQAGTGPDERVKARARIDGIATEVRSIMAPVTVRRNRLDLRNNKRYMQNLRDERKALAEQKLAQPGLYELSPAQMDFFDDIIGKVFGGYRPSFSGAVYQPHRFTKGADKQRKEAEQREVNIYGMLCRYLVNRFESSFEAFRKSVQSVHDYTRDALAHFERSGVFVTDRRQIEMATREADEPAAATRGQPKGDRFTANQFADTEAFKNALRKDMEALQGMLKRMDSLKLTENDPKLDAVAGHVRQVLMGRHPDIKPDKGDKHRRRIVVFSVYADTVEHVAAGLKRRFGDARITSLVGDEKTNKKVDEIKDWFDARRVELKDAPDVLVATDALSEGLDLNRAGLVINYDIPWNPTRVIQRIGRINRIGKQLFKTLYVLNFFPTVKGDNITHKRAIAGSKMHMIHQVVGEDAQVLDASETPSAADFLETINAGALAKEEDRAVSDRTAIENRFEKALQALKENRKPTLDRLNTYRDGIKSAAADETTTQRSLVLFRTDGFAIYPMDIPDVSRIEDPPGPIPLLAALDRIACPPETLSVPFGDDWWKDYDEWKDARRRLKTASSRQRPIVALRILTMSSIVKALSPDMEKRRKVAEQALNSSLFSPKDIKALAKVQSGMELEYFLGNWVQPHSVASDPSRPLDRLLTAGRQPAQRERVDQ